MAVYALGDRIPQIDPEPWVHPDATVIGDVRIGAGSTVWPRLDAVPDGVIAMD